jgi:SAM-dependent methyltransferase
MTRRLICAFSLCFLLSAQEAEFGASGDVPYVPTPHEIVKAMHTLAGTKAGDVHYDLGCGDGRLVIAAVKDFGAVRATGYDINPERIKEANENAGKAGVTQKVKFLEKNLFEADFRDASVVTLYLLPSVNLRLRPQLVDQLPAGARVVSHSFSMDDWQADKTIEVDGKTLYFWKITPEVKRKFGSAAAAGGSK